LRRPTTDAGAARLSRRALRAQNRAFSLEEVSQHRYADDGWIAVSGRVYDITEHVVAHKGWDTGCGMTEVLSILAHLGTDCTAEFGQIHACYPAASAQLRAYDIGPLAPSGGG
jgi:cytochrome b involved in lipid metabolism